MCVYGCSLSIHSLEMHQTNNYCCLHLKDEQRHEEKERKLVGRCEDKDTKRKKEN